MAEVMKREPQETQADRFSPSQQGRHPERLSASDPDLRTVDHWGDEMYRLLQERQEDASPERVEWMAAQIDGWYDLADVLRLGKTVR